MITLYKIIVGFFISSTIISCASTPIYKTVTDEEIRKIAIPDEYLTDCDIPSPPEIKNYEKLNWIEKEMKLLEYSRQLIKANKECELKIEAIRKINKEFLKLNDKDT